MSGHTPGPWTVCGETEIRPLSGSTGILADTNFWNRPPTAEQIANSWLIAAAPNLLEALEALLEETDDHARCASTGNGHFLSRGTRRQVTEAIAKARGVEDR